MSDWVADALMMIDNVVLESSPVLILASSLGGWISTALARMRPEKIIGMVLLGKG